MGTPPIDGNWDSETQDDDKPDHHNELIMGEMEIAPAQPVMGRIAPPGEGE